MADILGAVQAADTPLVLLTGLPGTGRTTVLAQLCERYEAEGRHVSALRFTPAGDVVPTRFTLVPEGRRDGAAAGLRGPVRGEPAWATIGPVAGAADEPAVAVRAAHAAAAALRRAGDGTVLLLDDLHWIDRDSLAVLEALIRMSDGRRLTCVGTLRVPANGVAARYGPEVLARLRKENLVHTLRLRPLTKQQLAGRLRATLQAAPEPALVDHLHALSRGVPVAVGEATEALRRRGAIRVLDRSAYLAPGTAAAEPPPPGECVKAVRDLGPAAWEAAKAMALLFPLGAAAAGPAAEVLGITGQEVLERWEALRAAGVLHRGRGGATWRFTVPFLATALAESCGPYERRTLAAAAVGALWSNAAVCPDPDHRTNLVADAGRLVDPTRAANELLGRATEARETDPESAVRWLDAAAGLGRDRAQVLLMLAAAHHHRGDYERSLHTARLVLSEFGDRLGPDAVLEAQSLLVRGLAGLGDTASLRDIADGKRRLPGDPGSPTVLRALACGLLDRWAEAERWADAGDPAVHDGQSQAVLARLVKALGVLWQGRPEFFEHSLLDRAQWPLREVPRHHVEQVNTHLTGLLVNGELGRAEELLEEEGLSWDSAGPANRTMAAVLRGDFWFATGLACRSVACRAAPGFAPATTGMFHATVSALVAQGRLTTAREVVTAARETTPALAHLLDFTEAWVDRALGDDRRAADRLGAALDAAGERGLVVGCDVAYAELTDLALALDDRETAENCLAAAERLAGTLATGRAALLAQLIRAVVARDPAAAAACLRSARERDQPFELSRTIVRLVRHGMAEPVLLGQAYELMGRIGALLHRAHARTLMREHGVVVPGRRNTVEENERLLATLAAEGLSNKQIAAALNTSEKSVEGRLSRLFTRSGYRSRIELSAAIVNGELSL
ncbi:AAA family ATPase [Amycolatopsis mongoliensis]|uniref:AAA family ATPase n=1 Tax=Amycolatopsis mongoliensis TaxID=715475 RepID=A0A9Y2JIP6_9PSEU|nr:AAA family ATPase [Amycolatopsis sp. 4-36]WIX98205.1 AAA family ATPase [Amycolatopsis sp. 4-36]